MKNLIFIITILFLSKFALFLKTNSKSFNEFSTTLKSNPEEELFIEEEMENQEANQNILELNQETQNEIVDNSSAPDNNINEPQVETEQVAEDSIVSTPNEDQLLSSDELDIQADEALVDDSEIEQLIAEAKEDSIDDQDLDDIIYPPEEFPNHEEEVKQRQALLYDMSSTSDIEDSATPVDAEIEDSSVVVDDEVMATSSDFLADEIKTETKPKKSSCALDENTAIPMSKEEVEYYIEEVPEVKNHLHGEPTHKILGPYTEEQIKEMTKYDHVVLPSERKIDEIYREEATKENEMCVGQIVQEDISLKTEDDKDYQHLKYVEKLILAEYAKGKTDDDKYVKILKANYQRIKERVKDLDTRIKVTDQMLKLKTDQELKQKTKMQQMKKLAAQYAKEEMEAEEKEEYEEEMDYQNQYLAYTNFYKNAGYRLVNGPFEYIIDVNQPCGCDKEETKKNTENNQIKPAQAVEQAISTRSAQPTRIKSMTRSAIVPVPESGEVQLNEDTNIQFVDEAPADSSILPPPIVRTLEVDTAGANPFEQVEGAPSLDQVVPVQQMDATVGANPFEQNEGAPSLDQAVPVQVEEQIAPAQAVPVQVEEQIVPAQYVPVQQVTATTPVQSTSVQSPTPAKKSKSKTKAKKPAAPQLDVGEVQLDETHDQIIFV
jgi:hypothetical protein